jgi:hypothetical protein
MLEVGMDDKIKGHKLNNLESINMMHSDFKIDEKQFEEAIEPFVNKEKNK